MMATKDPDGLSAHLEALRGANDGFAITVWSGPNEPGYRVWSTLDAKYAERDSGWLMTIPGAAIIDAIRAMAESR
jgi:hypothetical protein